MEKHGHQPIHPVRRLIVSGLRAVFLTVIAFAHNGRLLATGAPTARCGSGIGRACRPWRG